MIIEQPVIRLLDPDNNVWILEEPFKLEGYVVPKGFTTDLVTIPRIFWSIYPPFGSYLAPSIIHDYLIMNAKEDCLEDNINADVIFFNLMGLKELNINLGTRLLFTFICIIYHIIIYSTIPMLKTNFKKFLDCCNYYWNKVLDYIDNQPFEDFK